MLGHTIKVKTLTGTVDLHVAPGTTHGSKMRIRGKVFLYKFDFFKLGNE